MNDESEGKIICEFVGLTSKMYSIKNIVGEESNTARGVNMQQSLMNSKILYLTKKYSDTK